MRLKNWLALVLILILCPGPAMAANQTSVRLLLAAESAQPGETVLAGLHMKMAQDWHTYWRNPGEAGKSTQIEWTLPPGVTAGEIQWPVPEKYDWQGLINYVYHDEAVLVIPLTIAGDAKPGAVKLQGKVDWLECEELCVPGAAEVEASLTIGPASKPSADTAMLEEALARLPQPFTGDYAAAWWEGPGVDDNRPLIVSWSNQADGTNVDFYPYASASTMIQPKSEFVSSEDGRVRLRKVMEKYEGDWPKAQGGLLVEKEPDGTWRAAYAVQLDIVETEQAADSGTLSAEGQGSTTPAPESVATEMVALAPGSPQESSLWTILGLAFLGGLILNIMPCVLPVISLKILSFVNQSHDEPVRVRRMGLIYAAGVVASFLVLAGLVIGVQKAGQIASWGMQFGNPVFLVAMTVLVILVALNLFGLFEVNLGGNAMGAAGTLAAKEGPTGAFFNGVLATALATPCTAPFLSVALGFAFTKPPGVIVLTFITVALGLAAPYVILSWQPGWLKFLPKPGVWMQHFKVAMGFPMLATGIWLFSILSRHYGQEGILWVGWFIVSVSLAAWVWGAFVQGGRRRKGLAMAVSLLILGLGYGVTLESQLDWRHPREVSSEDSLVSRHRSGGIDWQPWSPEAVAAARQQGKPVFVDFTADWCATCKANERSSINIPSVIQKLKEIDAVALLADNTLLPKNIALELRKYQRAGVPLVLVYPKDASRPPLVLPTLLTPGIVLDALEQAAGTEESSGKRPST